MTAFADGEIITAKSSFPVMTSRATLATARSVVVQWLGLRNLPPLWHTGTNLMTFIA